MRSPLIKALARPWPHRTHRSSIIFRTFFSLLVSGLVMALAGCGGGSAPAVSNPTPNVTMLLQDAPANGVAAFRIDVTAVAFNTASGQAVALSNPGQSLELRHMQLSPTVAVEGFTSQAGTYKSLTLTLANPQLTVLNGSGQIVRLNTQTSPSAKLATGNVTVPMNVTLGNSGHVQLMLDFDVARSLSTDSHGNYIITPVINAGVLGGPPPAKLRGALATVVATFFNGPNVLSQVPINSLAGGTSNQQFFEVQLHDSGQAIPVTIDSSTVIDAAIGSMSKLRLGQLIYVSADVQDNGTFLASSIAAGPSTSSSHYQGLVTGVQKQGSGNSSFTVVVQN